MDLEPLAGAAIRQLCMRLLGSEPDAVPKDLEDFLAERSGGNPYFLEELVAWLLETGSVEIEGNSIRLTVPSEAIPTPDSVTGLIGSRIGTLDPDRRRYLQAAAVLGSEFNPAHMENLATRLEENWLDTTAADNLLDRGFLVTAGPETPPFRRGDAATELSSDADRESSGAYACYQMGRVAEMAADVHPLRTCPGPVDPGNKAGDIDSRR